jgi:hypothetical protein
VVNVGIFYDHLEYFMAIWYYLWTFVTFFQFWYVWNKKNLASLVGGMGASKTGPADSGQQAGGRELTIGKRATYIEAQNVTLS